MPASELNPRQFASLAERHHRQTQGGQARKIVRRGQHAAKILRKWLYRSGRPNGFVPGFAEPLSHEAFAQAAHLAFLAHDDEYLKKTRNAEKWAGFTGPLTRPMRKGLIRLDLSQHGLPPGVQELLVESRMLQDDFKKVADAERALIRIKERQNDANAGEQKQLEAEKKRNKETIDAHMAHIHGQHPAVLMFNAAQAQSYFVQRKKSGQKFNRMGVSYWPLSALALYGPYLEKGGLEKEGRNLSESALAVAYPAIHTHIQAVKKRYQSDVNAKKRKWQSAVDRAILEALNSPEGRAGHYADLAQARIKVGPLLEKSDASLYRTFGSKNPDNAENYRHMADVHDIVRATITLDHENEETAERACQQLQTALKRHLNHPRFSVQKTDVRRELDEKRGNDFSAFILALKLKQKAPNWLPGMEVQITTKRKDEINRRPENARTPRWMFFKGIVPKKDLRKTLTSGA